MAELLKLEYSAITDAILVTVDALTPQGGPYAGRYLQERFTLDEVKATDPTTAKALRDAFAVLEAMTREKVPAVATPAELEVRVAMAARKEEEIAADRKAADAEVTEKAAVAKVLDAQIAAKLAELDALAKTDPAPP